MRAGFLSSTTDPDGPADHDVNDYLGRVWKETVNSTVTSPSPVQQVTTYSYDGLDRQVLVTVHNVTPLVGSTPSVVQPSSSTQYFYQATHGQRQLDQQQRPAVAIRFPDGTWQQCSYDALGELIKQTNRDHSIHTYQYDLLGRQTKDSVSDLRRLWTARSRPGHDLRHAGRRDFCDELRGQPAVVNQVENVYDGLGNLVTQYQSHSGAVNTTSALSRRSSTSTPPCTKGPAITAG